MEDSEILTLFWARDTVAIQEVEHKYGKYCRSIAARILKNEEDTEECVNDTYLRAWDTIPPQRPDSLSAYLGKIARNLSLDRYRYNHAAKRTTEIDSLMSEMDECIPDSFRTEDSVFAGELSELINRFLENLPQKKRIIFMRRYWYNCSIAELAEAFSGTESQIKSILFRLRKDLQHYLEKEGYSV